jgi:uncharacterized membrane protein YgcG
MPTKVVRLIAICMITLAGSCSLYKDYQASAPANVLELEARLVQAGFRRVPIETPEQNGAVAELPMHRLNRYQSATGSVFWYADPTVCKCLYVGDQQDYETYAGILQQEHDTAEYINDVQPEQVVYLIPFGYAFPPPVLLGGWPVMIHSGEPFHSAGGTGSGRGGSGVTSKGSGGAIHSRGHGGGGHGISGHGGGHGRH